MQMLKVSGVKKIYKNGTNENIALNNINFSVEKGEFVSIVGSSGSGKTTLLQIIGGISKATEGDVEIQGHKLNKLNNEQLTIFRRRNIGFVFQNYNLLPFMCVRDNITFPVELDGKQIDTDFFKSVIEMLGIEKRLEYMPNMLSGGQQQRTAIARALISKPALILADEPTGNLDSQTKLDVMKLLRESSERYHQTILMITHDIHLAQMAERIIQIEDGKLVV